VVADPEGVVPARIWQGYSLPSGARGPLCKAGDEYGAGVLKSMCALETAAKPQRARKVVGGAISLWFKL
jgi:hypothetical protein